jgi:hypothetical protein
MRRLVVFLAVVAVLLGAVAAFDWWVDPYGEVYKPAALQTALAAKPSCLVSEELVGTRYFDFKLDVFRHRPVRTFVAGSSRVLKIRSHPGELSFANLGFPGTAPETLVPLFEALPAKPAQTVYLGVEAFWFNSRFAVPRLEPTAYQTAQYLLSRSTFEQAFKIAREAHYILFHRWRKEAVGASCVVGRIFPAIAWKVDGSREWSWELDPKRFSKFTAPRYTGDLATARNGYYADWNALDPKRVELLSRALAFAKRRGWRVVGFAPPEPPRFLHALETDPRLAPQWDAFLQLMARVFRRQGFVWAGLWNGRADGCGGNDFPDGFHSDAACSDRVRVRLDEAARRLH